MSSERMTWIWAEERPRRDAYDELERMRRQQRLVWHVLAVVAALELGIGGWILGQLFR